MDVISGDIPRAGHPDFKKEDLFDLWVAHQSKYIEDSKHDDQKSSGTSLDAKQLVVVDPLDEPLSPSNGVYAERQMLGFIGQLLLFTKRALVQQTREWGTFLFDLGLVLASGGFFGLIYYQRFYIGPSPASVVAQCPAALLEENPSPCRLPKDVRLPITIMCIITSIFILW
jgi:hypothetical protein